MNTKRLFTLVLSSAILGAPCYLAAQQDQSQESVADAARKARAERKTAPQAKLTIDNDNLGTINGVVSVVGETPAPPEDQTKKTDDKTGKAAGTEKKAPVKDESYWRDRFADANKKLADDQHELDIMQREFNLKQQQFYTDPMASLKQDYSRQDINDSRTKIDEKTAAIEQDKADLSNLEDQLRQAGGDAGWATPSAQPSQQESAPAPSSAPATSATPQP
jgi:chromosome segregation ATPase